MKDGWVRYKDCYAAALADEPGLEGSVAVAFVVDLDGSVQRAWDAASPPKNLDPEIARITALKGPLANPLPKSVAECVAREFQPLQFPAPKGGIVTVVFPIMFKP